jgi:tetratricopeptide (TPR) repeat protein
MENTSSSAATPKNHPAMSNEPSNAEIGRLMALYQHRQYSQAEQEAQALIQRFPKHGVIWKVLGAVLQAQGKIDAALQAKQTAAELLPNDAEAYNNLGNTYQQQDRLEEAEKCLRHALKIAPGSFVAMNNLGLTLEKQNRLAEAKSYYHQALTLNPNYVAAHYNYANCLQKLEEYDAAEESYRQALRLDPNYAAVYNNLVILLEKLDKLAEAESCCQKLVALTPHSAESHYSYGNILQKQERLQEAEKSYQQALALQPDYVDAHINYGNLLQKLKRFTEAEKSYRTVLAIKPNSVEMYNNLGMLLAKQERFAEAESCYSQAFALQPDYADGHCNVGMLLMLQGRLKEGWAEYQWVYHPNMNNPSRPTPPSLPIPQWQGGSLQGKTILILSEQGFGDMIQFARYAELLQQAGAKVWIVVKPPLVELFQTLPWIERILHIEEPLPPGCDFWTFPLALPFRFQTDLDTVPCTVPYLGIDAKKAAWWKIWLDKQIPKNHKRIGLVWAGRPTQGNDKNRSLNLNQFAVFAHLPTITFVSLQLGDKAEQLKDAPEGFNILDAGSFIQDFTDSAALLQNLDLLITVCSAPAHLAGALNVPVWTLISKPFDWRWLLNRSDSVWYKSMRLFRQPVSGDWQSVLEEVKAALITVSLPLS